MESVAPSSGSQDGMEAIYEELVNELPSMVPIAQIRSRDGRTDLHRSAKTGNLEEVFRLLSEGQDPDLKDWTGITPMDEAFYNQAHECYELMRQRSTLYRDKSRVWDINELTCPVCFCLFWKPLTNECGHTFCRACLQLSRKLKNCCPICRAGVMLTNGYEYNITLEKIIQANFPVEFKKAAMDNILNNPCECAIANLKELADGLQTRLTFDLKNSCVIKIDGEFSMHITFLQQKNQLFIYSPLLEGFPKSKEIMALIYERILFSSLNNKEMNGGGVGIISEKELIVYHIAIDMIETPSCTVKIMSISYVETIKYWRRELKKIIDDHASVPTDNGTLTVVDVPNKNAVSGRKRKSKRSATAVDHPGEKVISNRKRKLMEPDPEVQSYKKIRREPSRLSEAQQLHLVRLNINEVANYMKVGVNLDGPKIEVVMGGMEFVYDPDYYQITLRAHLVKNFPIDMDPTYSLPLFEKLLSGSTFGSLMLGGGVGLRKHSDQSFNIIIYSVLPMKHVKDQKALVKFVPEFKQMVEKWQKIAIGFIKDMKNMNAARSDESVSELNMDTV